MPEFELDLTNVESEVVDGVTVVKAAEVTAVSLVGLSAEEATANLHANAAAIGRAFPAPIPGLNWAFKAAADAEAKAERERRALEPLAERPPVEYVGSGYLRRCAHCDYRQITPVGITAEAQHFCQRDGVTYLIMWPRG